MKNNYSVKDRSPLLPGEESGSNDSRMHSFWCHGGGYRAVMIREHGSRRSKFMMMGGSTLVKQYSFWRVSYVGNFYSPSPTQVGATRTSKSWHVVNIRTVFISRPMSRPLHPLCQRTFSETSLWSSCRLVPSATSSPILSVGPTSPLSCRRIL